MGDTGGRVNRSCQTRTINSPPGVPGSPRALPDGWPRVHGPLTRPADGGGRSSAGPDLGGLAMRRRSIALAARATLGFALGCALLVAAVAALLAPFPGREA